MKVEKRFSLWMLAIVCCLFLSAVVLAAPGDLLKNITVPVISPSCCGIGIEVDCQGNLYYTNSYSAFLYKIDKDGNLLDTKPLTDAAGGGAISFGAISWDNNRQKLWAGTDNSGNPVKIYLIDLATGIATYQFTTHTAWIGFTDGISYDHTDSTVWVSDDVSNWIDHFKDDGTYLGTLYPKNANGDTLTSISGVLVGKGDLLYLGRNGFGEIVKVKKSDGTFIGSFSTPGGRDEDLACDPLNFAPTLVVWSKDAYNNTVTAIEVEEGTCVCGTGVTPVKIDIKPQSCPNPLNVQDRGVIPVAILGTADFDVSQVDPATVKLEGVSPIRWSMEDVATPVEDGEECECTTAGADGYMDLVFHFSAPSVIEALGAITHFTFEVLTLTGELKDDTPIEGKDCVRIQIPGGSKKNNLGGGPYILSIPTQFSLSANYPNPFNTNTSISYGLPKDLKVELAVYNIRGQKVKTLVDQFQNAGVYTITWDGKDESGNGVASGIYFYSLRADKQVLTNRMTLLK